MTSADDLPPSPRSKKLRQAMSEILASRHDTDVTFIVHGEEIHAHKLILANRSPVLKAMIEGPMAPADQQHEINDPEITAEDFENFLKFLYTDKCDMQESNFKTMLHLGNFYDVPYLLEECARKMNFLTPENVYYYAEMALFYAPTVPLFCYFQNIIMCCACKKSLTYRINDKVGTLKWISPDLVLEIVKQILRNSSTFITEDALFKKVFEWAPNYCVQDDQEANVENIQALMAPLMPHFDLESFSPLTLATIVKGYNLIPVELLNDYLSDHIIKAADENGYLCMDHHRNGNAVGESYRRSRNFYGDYNLSSLPTRGRVEGTFSRGGGGSYGSARGGGYEYTRGGRGSFSGYSAFGH